MSFSPAMSMTVEVITPEIAAEYLKRNTDNRTVRRSSVVKWATAMRRGEWMVTHQGIAFDTDGRLVDGQHRLLAVIEVGITLHMAVFRNADPRSFLVLDVGAKRSVADTLRLDNRVAPALNLGARLCFGTPNPSNAQLEELKPVLVPLIDDLLGAAAAERRYFTSAPVKIAAVARLLDGGDRDYILGTYKSLARYSAETMPRIALSLIKQVEAKKAVANNTWDTLGRMWKVFDVKSNGLTKLELGDDAAEATRLRVTQVLRVALASYH